MLVIVEIYHYYSRINVPFTISVYRLIAKSKKFSIHPFLKCVKCY